MKKKNIYTSVLLVLLALVSLSAATVAWFTIADQTKLRSMNLEITTGSNLRFDLDAHASFDEYVKTLSMEQIAARIRQEKGVDVHDVPLEPVTTADYRTFTSEEGIPVEKDSGAYLEFTLHFMATEDMLVHLTSENSAGRNDGTLISSSQPALPAAMRVSFTVGGFTWVYDPGRAAGSDTGERSKQFGLPEAEQMVLNEENGLFFLTAGEDLPVIVQIWLEGTDEACTDALRNADYLIQLRFIGTDIEKGTENTNTD